MKLRLIQVFPIEYTGSPRFYSPVRNQRKKIICDPVPGTILTFSEQNLKKSFLPY